MNLDQLPVETLGITEEKREELARLGIISIEDLLTYFPFRYDDFRLSDLARAENDERVTIQGVVVRQPSLRWYGKKKSRLAVKVQVEDQVIQVIWFNQFYLKKKIRLGETIAVSGRWNEKRKEVTVDRTFLTEMDRQKYLGRFEPIYSITRTLKMKWLRQLIHNAFVKYGAQIQEILPETYVKRYRPSHVRRRCIIFIFPKERRSIIRRDDEWFMKSCSYMNAN